jgi:ceramide glucosyltransferase
MIPLTIFFEPISECMFLGIMAAWATSFLFRWDPIAVFLIHLLIWFIMDWALIHIVQVSKRRKKIKCNYSCNHS